MTTPAKPTEKAITPTPAHERKLRFPDPFGVLEDLQDEMARIWGQRPLFPLPLRMPRPIAQAATTWAPRMDVYEKQGHLVMKAELPGVKKEDIKVELDGEDLIIEAERKADTEVKEQDYYRTERFHGTCYRRLPLGFAPKPEQIKAAYSDGILEIQIPKPAEPATKTEKIAVH